MAHATALKVEHGGSGGAGQAARARRKIVDLGDSQVVQRFLDGDDRAFTELVRRYETRLLAFVQRTIGDQARAEDLVQEAFVRVFRHLHRFDQSRKFSSWIYTIAGNLAKNELRNRSRNPLVLFQTLTKNWVGGHAAPGVGGPEDPSRRPLPEALPAREGGGGRRAVAGPPPDSLRPPGDRGQDLRGDRGDHRLQLGHR